MAAARAARPRKNRNWGTIATIAALPLTVVIFLAGPYYSDLVNRQLTERPTAPLPGASGVTPPGLPGETVASAPPPAPDCVDGDGRRVGCSDAGARLIVLVSPCDLVTLSSALGAPTGMQLDIEAKPVGSHPCTASPGPTARSAGATTEDIRRILEGSIDSALIVCQVTLGSTDTPCSQPHSAEGVTGWEPDVAHIENTCVESARIYTGRNLSVPGDPLRAQVVHAASSGRDLARCYVASTEILHGSVYRIGHSALPRSTTPT